MNDMTKKPWYHEGLRFECTGCGDCCTGAPGYVWVDDEEIAVLAAAVGIELEDFVARYTRRVAGRTSLVEFSNGDCVFFDDATRRCMVYDDRPRQCRTWPFWDSNLSSPAEWARTGRSCPGVDNGPLFPLQAIRSRAKVIDV